MIQIRNLRKQYADGHLALDGVDLDIGDDLLGVLGPNGAGKTTLLSILVLLLEPTSGTIDYGGLDPRKPSHCGRIRRMLGYLPQDFAPLPWLDGFEYLVHCARLRSLALTMHEIENRARHLLDAVDLTSAARRKAGTYSGGMKRRLGIAQAMIHGPRVVIVDEPTAGLDPEERIHFRNLIGELGEVTSVVLSTHIAEDIEATCSRIAVVTGGRIAFNDAPAQLMRSLRGRLWEVDADSASGEIVSEFVEDGRARAIVKDERPPAGAVEAVVTLERAYSTLLLEIAGERA